MTRSLAVGLLILFASAATVAQNLPDTPQQQLNARGSSPVSFRNSLPEQPAKVADKKWVLGAAVTIGSGILASTRSHNEGRAFAINMPIALTADLASYEFKKHYHKRLHGVLWILPSALADGYFGYQITNPGSAKRPPVAPIAGCRTNCTQSGGSGSGASGNGGGSGSGSGSGSGASTGSGSGPGSAGSGSRGGAGSGGGSGSTSGSGSGVGS